MLPDAARRLKARDETLPVPSPRPQDRRHERAGNRVTLTRLTNCSLISLFQHSHQERRLGDGPQREIRKKGASHLKGDCAKHHAEQFGRSRRRPVLQTPGQMLRQRRLSRRKLQGVKPRSIYANLDLRATSLAVQTMSICSREAGRKLENRLPNCCRRQIDRQLNLCVLLQRLIGVHGIADSHVWS